MTCRAHELIAAWVAADAAWRESHHPSVPPAEADQALDAKIAAENALRDYVDTCYEQEESP
jgi:hypothetical protein